MGVSRLREVQLPRWERRGGERVPKPMDPDRSRMGVARRGAAAASRAEPALQQAQRA